MVDKLAFFDPEGASRINKAVLKVEAIRPNQVLRSTGTKGDSRKAPGASIPYVEVELQSTMHHGTTDPTIGHRVRNYADQVLSLDDENDIKIYPGWQKGIWFRGDVVKVAQFSGRWIPITGGRTYFEAPLVSTLNPGGTGLVVIDGEAITVRDPGFATEPVDPPTKISVILSNLSFVDMTSEWHYLPHGGGSSPVRCGKTKVTFYPGEVCTVAVWVPDETGGLDHVLLDENEEEVWVDVIDADLLTADLPEDTPVLFAPVNGVLTLIAPTSIDLPWGCIYGKSGGGDYTAWKAVTIQSLDVAINPADTEEMAKFTKGTRVWTLADYTGSSIDLHGVTQEAIGPSETGIVRVFGQGPVQISVTDANLVAYATPDPSNPSVFKAGAAGKHRIRTIESGIGTKWGVIDLHSTRRHIPWGCVLAFSGGVSYPAWQAVSIVSLLSAIDSGDSFGMSQFTHGERIWSLADYTVSQMNLFAVTQEEIGPNKVGLVRVYGLTPCQVNVTNASYKQFAMPDPSNPSVFKAGSYGPCLIKEVAAGTGVKWATIDVHSERFASLIGVLSGTISTTGGSASANIDRGGSLTGETVTFEDYERMLPSTGAASGRRVRAEYDYQLQKAVIKGFKC